LPLCVITLCATSNVRYLDAVALETCSNFSASSFVIEECARAYATICSNFFSRFSCLFANARARPLFPRKEFLVAAARSIDAASMVLGSALFTSDAARSIDCPEDSGSDIFSDSGAEISSAEDDCTGSVADAVIEGTCSLEAGTGAGVGDADKGEVGTRPASDKGASGDGSGAGFSGISADEVESTHSKVLIDSLVY
jgi:hypothetical protein